MTESKRGGRVTKAPPKKSTTSHNKSPKAPYNSRGKAAQKRNERPAVKATRSWQGEEVDSTTSKSDAPPTAEPAESTTLSAEPHRASSAAALPASKVERVYNGLWASTLDSIAFALNNTCLGTDDHVNVITLNLIDHIIRPENWNPDLSYNVLVATCFFFASLIAGHKGNTPDKIATAMDVDLHLAETMAGPQVHYDPVVRARLASALCVSEEDVKKGYRILFEQRNGLEDLVGVFARELHKLPHPEDIEAGRMEQPVSRSVEAATICKETVKIDEAAEKASVDEAEVEFDELDRFVDENE